MLYDEFRLQVTPDLRVGRWRLELQKCPIPGLVGDKGSIEPALSVQQVSQLRSRHGWPNLAALQTIGSAVWKSLMNPDATAAFVAARQVTRGLNRGLRVVVVFSGEEAVVNPEHVRLAELPVEALRHEREEFVATNYETPVSRSSQAQPDAEPQHAYFPLRVLVFIASPNDKPKANIAEEKRAIQEAVAEYVANRLIDLDICEHGTSEALNQKLREKFQVLHSDMAA